MEVLSVVVETVLSYAVKKVIEVIQYGTISEVEEVRMNMERIREKKLALTHDEANEIVGKMNKAKSIIIKFNKDCNFETIRNLLSQSLEGIGTYRENGKAIKSTIWAPVITSEYKYVKEFQVFKFRVTIHNENELTNNLSREIWTKEWYYTRVIDSKATMIKYEATNQEFVVATREGGIAYRKFKHDPKILEVYCWGTVVPFQMEEKYKSAGIVFEDSAGVRRARILFKDQPANVIIELLQKWTPPPPPIQYDDHELEATGRGKIFCCLTVSVITFQLCWPLCCYCIDFNDPCEMVDVMTDPINYDCKCRYCGETWEGDMCSSHGGPNGQCPSRVRQTNTVVTAVPPPSNSQGETCHKEAYDMLGVTLDVFTPGRALYDCNAMRTVFEHMVRDTDWNDTAEL